MKQCAFTLIELLIVVAIIAILAAIAVPNFLEAQARAKNSRAMNDLRTMCVAIGAYEVDWNQPMRDQNDPDSPPDIKGRSWNQDFPGETPDMSFTVSRNYYQLLQWRQLTTPVAYMTFRPIQAYSHNVPYGLDTRGYDTGANPPIAWGDIVYWVILCGGPDRNNGEWYRGNNPDRMGCPYDPTNGTISRGDIWRGEQFIQTVHFRNEYGPWPLTAR